MTNEIERDHLTADLAIAMAQERAEKIAASARRSIGNQMMVARDMFVRRTGIKPAAGQLGFVLTMSGWDRLREEAAMHLFRTDGSPPLDAAGHFMDIPCEPLEHSQVLRYGHQDFALVTGLERGALWYGFALEQGLRMAALVKLRLGEPATKRRPSVGFLSDEVEYRVVQLMPDDRHLIAIQTIAARIAE